MKGHLFCDKFGKSETIFEIYFNQNLNMKKKKNTTHTRAHRHGHSLFSVWELLCCQFQW